MPNATTKFSNTAHLSDLRGNLANALECLIEIAKQSDSADVIELTGVISARLSDVTRKVDKLGDAIEDEAAPKHRGVDGMDEWKAALESF